MTSEPTGKISYWIPAAFAAALGVVLVMPYLARIGHSVAGPTAFAMTTNRPSFSCARAVSAPELAICSDADLSALDAQMGDLYAPRVRAHPEFRDDQRAWLRQRNVSCGGDVGCLKQSITARIAQLQAMPAG